MSASQVLAAGDRAQSLLDVLAVHAACHADRAALQFVSDDGRTKQTLTYGELQHQALLIASILQSRAEAGSRVLLVCPPGLEFATAFFGCLAAGMVAVPTSAPHPRRLAREWPRLHSVLGDCSAAIIITSAELREPLIELTRREMSQAAVTVLSFEDLRDHTKTDQRRSLPAISRQQLALLQYTSGSTGTPRGVMISHGNLVCNLQSIQEAFGTNAATVGVFWLPFHHDMGLIGGLLGTLYCGGTSTFISPLAFVHRPLRWLQLISETRANISGGPNFAYEECVRRISAEARSRLDLSTWNVAFCGAEPIHAETLNRFAEAFSAAGFRRTAFLPCYGLAESTLLVTGRATGQPMTVHRRTSQGAAEPDRVGCGVPAVGQRVWIVSPESLQVCPVGEVGEIWVAGDSVGQGYWGRPEESQQTFFARTADGDGPFLRSGDLGYFWSGELFVTGRLKDLIIIHGRNHYPQDLERTVNGCHPLLRDNACVAFSVEADQAEQLVIVAEVEPRVWAKELAQNPQAGSPLVEAVSRAIGKFITEQHEVTPWIVRLVPAFAIPRTSSGKVRRRVCRDRFLAGELPGILEENQSDGDSVVG